MATKKYEKKESRDYQQELNNKIIGILEEAEQNLDKGLKWEMPFFKCNERPINGFTGERYNGANVMALMVEGYDDPRWMTFKQMEEKSKQIGKPLHLEKGSKAAYVMKVVPVYEKEEVWVEAPGGKKTKEEIVKKDSSGKPMPVRDEHGNPKISFKWYPVFNASQIVGMEPYMKRETTEEVKPHEAVEMLSMALQERTGLRVEHSARGQAYYSPSEHLVHMPKPELFKSADHYADTALHEYGHSTGKALGRDLTGQFGSALYAKEELVAELTSCYMAMELGVHHNPSTHENQAAYIKSWLKALKDDKTLITKAASQASKATEYLVGHYEAYKQELAQKNENRVTQAEDMAKDLIANLTKKPAQNKPTKALTM